jgi:autotransporter adhesin
VGNNRQIASDGIAIALASKSPTLAPGQNAAVTFSLGNYDSSTAFAVGGAYRLDDGIQAYGTLGTVAGSGNVGSSIGVQFSW